MKRMEHEVDFQVKWRPFQLYPDAPGGAGVDKWADYKTKYGTFQTSVLTKPFMYMMGRPNGIKFAWGGNTGNTFDSHQLILYAEKYGKQDELVEELFLNYFEQEKCLSDHSVLLAAADKVGLKGAEEVLASNSEGASVDMEIRKYGQNVRSVPHFSFNDGAVVASGSYGTKRFVEIIRGVLESN